MPFPYIDEAPGYKRGFVSLAEAFSLTCAGIGFMIWFAVYAGFLVYISQFEPTSQNLIIVFFSLPLFIMWELFYVLLCLRLK